MEWIMAHPWMTFFLLMAAISASSDIIMAVCKAVSSRKRRDQDSENQ